MTFPFELDRRASQTIERDQAISDDQSTVDYLAELSNRLRTVTPGQLAKILGVGDACVRRFIKDGELVALNMARVGSRMPRFAIPIEEVKRFLERRSTVTRAGSSRVRRF